MKKTYIIIIASLFYITVVAKTPKADRLYENWEYFEAAKLYEKEAAKRPTADVYYKLGECYRKMNCYKKEEQAAYDKVNAEGVYSKPEFYLNYGQVLKTNGKYAQAKVAFDKYSELVPADPRGKFYSASIDIITEDRKYEAPISISNVAALNTNNADFSPVFFKDGIVFTSSRKTQGHGKIYSWTGANYLDLYYAKKGSNDTTFNNIAPFGGKNSNKKYHDGPATFSKNSDTIYISRVEKYLQGEDKKTLKIERNKIFISTMKDDKWTKAIPFAYNSDNYSMANPFIAADGTKLYFVSDMPGGYGETDIYYCNREGAGWGKPVNMGPSVNTFNRERFPNVDADGNFYFASDGYQGFGGLDICVALNKNGTLEKAKPMKYPFNSASDDYGIVFLKNGKTGYISSNRSEGGKGDDDILYFDLLRDKLDSNIVTSIYTIGYKPKQREELAQQPVDIKDSSVKTMPGHTVIPMQIAEMRIYFDYDKFNIRTDAISKLDSVANFMKRSPGMKLVIGGHCDTHGTPEYNITLSNNRDNSVIQYLAAKGISSKRISATGYGLTKIVNHCEKGVVCSDAEEQLNRRVEFRFVEKSK